MKKNKKIKRDNISIELHQHKIYINGSLHVFGFPHPITAKHKNKKTQIVHDLTIQIDSKKSKKGISNYGK